MNHVINHFLGFLEQVFTNIFRILAIALLLGWLCRLVLFEAGWLDTIKVVGDPLGIGAFIFSFLFAFVMEVKAYVNEHRLRVNNLQQAIIYNQKEALKAESIRREEALKAESIRREEASTIEVAKDLISQAIKHQDEFSRCFTRPKKANKKTKDKFIELKYFLNFEQRVSMIRKYGIQRFMFEQTEHKPKRLANQLSKLATETNIGELINNLSIIYYFVPLVTHWLSRGAKPWLQQEAGRGHYLPREISFHEIIIDALETEQWTQRTLYERHKAAFKKITQLKEARRTSSKNIPTTGKKETNEPNRLAIVTNDYGSTVKQLELALKVSPFKIRNSLISAKIVQLSPNVDEQTALEHFYEELINTPEIRRLKNRFMADGISFSVTADSGIPHLLFDEFRT